MFDNIGGKIKGLAWFILVAEMLFFFVIANIIIYNNVLDDKLFDGIWKSILTMFIGTAISWCSVLLLYGFGELIERTVAIEENTRYLASEKYKEKAEEEFQKRKTANKNSYNSEDDENTEESFYNPFNTEQ